MLSAIEAYFERKGLKWPDSWRALGWANTELAEVYELILAKDGGWVRNNPEDHDGWSPERFAEELGDTIMMLLVAGYAEGVDALLALENKIGA